MISARHTEPEIADMAAGCFRVFIYLLILTTSTYTVWLWPRKALGHLFEHRSMTKRRLAAQVKECHQDCESRSGSGTRNGGKIRLPGALPAK